MYRKCSALGNVRDKSLTKKMQAGYAIFNIEVTNTEDYKEYVEKVKPIAAKFGGDYIVRGGTNQIIEDRQIMIQWD